MKLVLVYVWQASLSELAALAQKWRSVAQAAAEQLLKSSSTHPPPSMMSLLTFMHVEPSLIHYCPVNDDFYE